MEWIAALALALVCGLLLWRLATISREKKAAQQALQEKNELLNRQAAALEEQQERFKTLAEGISEGLVVGDYKNAMARQLDVDGPGEFVADGKVYSARALSDSMLLIRDMTEQGQAEKMRQELTANVSHELKTPLHAISGYAEMLAQGMVQPQDVAGFAGNIYKEAGRMIRLVEDILNLSRLDAGQGYEWVDIDLFEKARQTVELLQPVAKKAGVSLILSGKPSVVRAIDQLLGMVIFNLCDNAIKYNRPGGRVEIQAVDGVLTVVDTGIGIPKEAQSRIFERFYRVDKSRSKAVGGTGLGLSIVKHAARVMNARVDLQSDEGQGTKVTVEFGP